MLKVEGLHVRYGPIAAVRGISFNVETGELVALLGANGAGKSSTLLAIAGALRASEGRITLDEKDITGVAPERIVRGGISMVPETRDIFPDLTVTENLRLGGFVHRKNPKAWTEDRDMVLEIFPVLGERANQAAGTLSGGEQQQLAIARSMMTRPKLLVLDEPSLGLAPAIVERIFDMIRRLRDTGLTILLVEQNANMALKCADRVYVMALGEIAAAGTAEEIASTTDLASIYLGAGKG
jgi:branched-chain amino acid transport system ATP-binding protein